MTSSQAADLRLRWKQRTNPPECRHVMLELETSDVGYLTGDYVCMVCGDVARKAQSWGGGMTPLIWTTGRPTTPGWYWWRLNRYHEPDMLKVVLLGDKLLTFKGQDERDTPDGEWIGPLDPPV